MGKNTQPHSPGCRGHPPAQPREGTQSRPVVLHVSWLSSPPQSPALLTVIFNSLHRLLSPGCAFPISTDDHTICLPEKGEIFGKENHPLTLPEQCVQYLQLRPPSPPTLPISGVRAPFLCKTRTPPLCAGLYLRTSGASSCPLPPGSSICLSDFFWVCLLSILLKPRSTIKTNKQELSSILHPPPRFYPHLTVPLFSQDLQTYILSPFCLSQPFSAILCLSTEPPYCQLQ